MNADVKAQWLAALRSGEYEQTDGYLHNDNGYCCLGVLCDLAVKNKVIPEPTADPDNYSADTRIYGAGDEERAELPPEAVTEWAGFGRDDWGVAIHNPAVTVTDEDFDSDQLTVLSELNDTYGWSFSQIADVIEEQL